MCRHILQPVSHRDTRPPRGGSTLVGRGLRIRSGEGLRGLGCGLDTCRARSSRGTTRPAEPHTSADRVADEVRGGVARSGEGYCGLGRGLDTCPAPPSRGTTRPAEGRGTTRPAEPHTSADRVADEERGGVSRSGEGLWGLGLGLDTCPAPPSRGTTRPAEGRGTTRPAEPHTSADRVADEERGGVSRSGEGLWGLGRRSRHVPGSFLAGHYSTSGSTGQSSASGTPHPLIE